MRDPMFATRHGRNVLPCLLGKGCQVALLAIALLCAALPTGTARAATFQVTNTDPAGAGSLSQAVDNVNASPDPDNTVSFEPGAAGTIDLATELVLERNASFINDNAAEGVSVTYTGMNLLTVASGTTLALGGTNSLCVDVWNADLANVIFSQGPMTIGLIDEFVGLAASVESVNTYAQASTIFVNDGHLTLNGDIYGTLYATALAENGNASAHGIYTGNGGVFFGDGFSGMISASASATGGDATAHGMSTNSGDLIFVGPLTGLIMSAATSTNRDAYAFGLQASMGDVRLDGGLYGLVAANAQSETGDAAAYGLLSDEGINMSDDIIGVVLAMADAPGGSAEAVGLQATGDLALVGVTGEINVASNGQTGAVAYGLSSLEGNLTLGGPFEGQLGVVASASDGDALAYGLLAVGGHLVLGGDLAGEIQVMATSESASQTGTAEAYGLQAEAGSLNLQGCLTGTVTVMATGNGATTGLGLAANQTLAIDGGLDGAVLVNASSSNGAAEAGGLTGHDGLSIGGDLGGAVGVTAEGTTAQAFGLSSEADDLAIGGSLYGDVTVTAIASNGSATAGGLVCNGNLVLGGELSGTVTASAQATGGTATAYGLYADGAINGGGADIPLLVSGNVTAMANGLAVAIASNGALNLYLTGTLSGVDVSGGGQGYAIRTGSAADTVTLDTGANLTGRVDLGAGADTVTMLGSGTTDSTFSGVETLVAGDGGTNTNWTLAPDTGTSSFGTLTVTDNAALTVNEHVAVTDTIDNAGSLTFDLAGNATQAAIFAGAGDLIKTGSGILTLTGDSSGYTGPTTVNLGTLALGTTGSLGGTVTVANGGSIGGTGTVANLVNNGQVAPGNSIGTLTVTGNYVQGATAVFTEEIATDGTGDLLRVGGTATLNGGQLAIVTNQGYYASGVTWTVLAATGGLTGTFASVTQDYASSTLVFTPSYTANNVLLTVSRTPYAAFARDSRAVAVGNALNAAGAAGVTGDLATLLATLDYSSASGINQILGMLSPEPFDAFNQGLFDAGRLLTASQLAALHERDGQGSAAFAGPLDTGPAMAQGLASQGKGNIALPAIHTGVSASADGQTTAATLANAGCSVFLRPFGMLASQEAGGGRTGYTATTGGITGGLTWQPRPGLTFGIAPGFLSQYVSLKTAGGGHGTVNDWSLALLGGYRQDAWYVDGLVRIGYNTYQTTRSLPVPGMARSARGVWSGWNTAVAVAGGYDFQVGQVTLGPIASVEWQHISQDSFSETGAGGLGLKVGSRSDHTLTTTLGGRIYRVFETSRGTITPELRVAWAAQWLDGRRSLTSSFAGYPQTGFTTKTANQGYHAAIIDAGVTMSLSKSLSVTARGGVELFRPGYASQAASLSLKYTF